MYWMEWISYLNRKRPKPGSILDQYQSQTTTPAKRVESEGRAREKYLYQRCSEHIDDHHAIYRHTNTYIDVCTYNDDKRGLISLVLGVMYWGFGGIWLGDALADSVPAIWNWQNPMEKPWTLK